MQVDELLDELRRRGATLATAESLTGGRLAALVTGVAGASRCYVGGVVAYATDVPVLSSWGTPYLFGPGSINVAHRDDEHIAIEELHAAVDAYERLGLAALERLAGDGTPVARIPSHVHRHHRS